jgi:alanine racemase
MHSDILAMIDTDRLVHNYRAVRACCRPNVTICAMLKGDAYGHAIAIVAPVLQAIGVEFAAVATLQEAVDLRLAGWQQPILVLGNVLAVADPRERRERVRAIVKYKPALTIADPETLVTLAKIDLESCVDVHIKVDTGMGRMGCMPNEVADLIRAIKATSSLRLTGIYSHFATADLYDSELAQLQLAQFNKVLADVGQLLPLGVVRHMANSAATIAMPEAHFDMVRPGLALYGHPPAEHLFGQIDLKPILRLVSHLTTVKDLPAGHCVGYGQTFVTQQPTRLGIVPIGYCDGYLRALSNASVVSTPEGDAPVIGRVSMDQLALDLTDLKHLQPGHEVTLIDDRPDRPNSIWSIARRLDTIPYEVLCLLGPRIQRLATGSFCAAGEVGGELIAKPQLHTRPMCRTR